MTPVQTSDVDTLMHERRYASVIQRIPASSTHDLLAVRAEAQQRFGEGVRELNALYLRQCGLAAANDEQVTELLSLYDDRVGDIFDPQEAEAYANALIDQANQAMSRVPVDRDTALLALYAAQILPAQPMTRDTITTLIGDVRSIRPAMPTGVSAGSERPIHSDPRPTRRLTTEELGDQTTHVPTDDEVAPAQIALERLEALLLQAAPTQIIREQFTRVQTLIPADSPLAARLDRMREQMTALDQLPRLNALLDRPIAEWLLNLQDLQREATEILSRVARAFSLDTPLVRDTHARLDDRLKMCNRLSVRIQGLSSLMGESLLADLANLEQELSPDFPLLRDAQERRDQYLQDQETGAARQEQVRRRESARALRLNLDNALRAAVPDFSQIAKFQQAAEQTAADKTLGDDNPFDTETLAYYDLMLNDLRARSTVSDEVQAFLFAAQTAAATGDLVLQLEYYRRALEQARTEESPEAERLAREGSDITYQQLKEKLQQEARATILQAEQQIAAFEYAPALLNLRARLKNADDAAVEIEEAPEQLRSYIEALIDQAQTLEQRDQQVRALEQQAAQLAPPDSTAPNFPAAITALEGGLGIAQPLDVRLRREIERYRSRWQEFVQGLIQRADSARRGRDYPRALQLLDQATAAAFTDEQRADIDTRRQALDQQRQNDENYQTLSEEFSAFADSARQGVHVDQIAAQVAGARQRIGPAHDPKLEQSRWAVLDEYLRLAEDRVVTWRAYRETVSQAEQAAMVGDRPKMDEVLARLNAMVLRGGQLPSGTDEQRIRRLSRQTNRIERIRTLLDEIRTSLDSDPDSVTSTRITTVLMTSDGMETEDDIADDRRFLQRLLPICRAREQLSELAEKKDFRQLRDAFEQLPELVRDHPSIVPYRRQAEDVLAREAFEGELRQLVAEVRSAFNRGWGKGSLELPTAVGKVRDFAARHRIGENSGEPRLTPAAIQQLDALASQLIDAHSAYDQGDYSAARRQIGIILQDIPINGYDDTNLLYGYYAELSNLRQNLQSESYDLAEREKAQKEKEGQFEQVVKGYLDFICDPDQCFNQEKLSRQISSFRSIADSRRKPEVDRYTRLLTTIIEILRKVDSTAEVAASHNPVRSSGTLRDQLANALTDHRQRAEALLIEIGKQSEQVRHTDEGQAWPGIEADKKYQALRASMGLIEELGRADAWLQYAETAPREAGALEAMLNIGRQILERLRLDPNGEARLKEHGLGDLMKAVRERAEMMTLLGKESQAALEHLRREHTQRTRRNRILAALVAVVMIALLVLAGWRTPRVREQVITLAIGTLTPLPTTTAPPVTATANSAVAVVTATPLPTLTPIPTSTPVPPQQGVIVFPGRIFVYQVPDTSTQPLTFVAGGDKVQLTGFFDDGDTRWYRMDVTSKNLRDVWMVARAPDRGSLYDTVDLYGEPVHQELRVSKP